MADFILFMHADCDQIDASAIEPYLEKLRRAGAFAGGSEIGEGACFKKLGAPGPLAAHIGGFIRIQAENLAAAKALLEGNPTYEAGGTVEIRSLPAT